ncbi:uncharacterized protein LOC117908644 [Vitis riparia]|uniref:uncharacterized protein LOC117908644 n=1 Tax=Vitis riparia TaxID=96939 RepID=UPI00155A6444|nr:uncharacterized protein LOC117908644 [Vitis riparia]
MQFGMDQDLPGCVPECDESPKIAWSNYISPLMGYCIFHPDYLIWMLPLDTRTSGSRQLRRKPMVPLILRFFLQHEIPQNGEIPMMVEEMLRYKQGDSDDEDKMMVGEMLRSIINPKSVGNKPASDDKPSPGCQLQGSSPSAAKVGAIRQQLVMKYLGVAAGGSEKAMEGGNGSNGGSSALMGGSERDMEDVNRSHSGTGTMNRASGEVVERAAKCRTGIAAIVGGSEKGVEDAIEIKETGEKLVLVQLRYQDWNLKPGCASLRRWLLDSKQKDFATAFEKRTTKKVHLTDSNTKAASLVRQPSLVLHKLI